MKFGWLYIFAGFILIPGLLYSQNSYYVDPSVGNDNNDGLSINSPFKSVYKARDVVRTVNGNMKNDISVYLKGGTYQLDSTFTLSKQDQATNGHYIIYQPYQCETPILSGGVKISNWVLYDAAKNIYKATVDPLVDSRQLYVNGVRAIRARSIDAIGWEENEDGYDCPLEVESWKNISDVEVVSFMVWKCHRGPIASVENGHAKMAQPYWDNLHLQYNAPPVWIENAYELLDTEGEWYLDRTNATLYYKPLATENMETAEVFLAKQETLVSCVGVNNIEFRGVGFSHATWLNPNTADGFPCHQVDQILSNPKWENFEQIPGNISLEKASNIKFTSCFFEHLGSTALQLKNGCKNNLIYNNVFSDISGSAISIGSLNDSLASPENQTFNNSVSNNYITNVACEFRGCVGILVGYTKQTIVTHNEIRNLPYTGISLGWGWSNTETFAGNNEISYNLIDSVMTVMHDGGAIYTLSAQRGTQVNHNYIKNGLNEPGAVHVDEGSSFIHFHHNVLSNVSSWINLWSTTSLRDTVDFNYYDNEKNVFSGTDCIMRNNVYVTNNNWPVNALEIMRIAGRLPVNKCSYNATTDNIAFLKVYPNPTAGSFQVVNEKPYPENYSIEVYSIQGQLLQIERKSKTQLQFSIELKNYPEGLYFLRIVSGKYIYHYKVIKL
jgi:hypothetical protein